MPRELPARVRAARMRLAELWRAVQGDGCTSAPDLRYGECCRQHDADYTHHCDETGKRITRAQADARLRACMAKAGALPIAGRFLLPWGYWLGVRIFGARHWRRNRAAAAGREHAAQLSHPGGRAVDRARDDENRSTPDQDRSSPMAKPTNGVNDNAPFIQ